MNIFMAAMVWIMIDASPGITTEFLQDSFEVDAGLALVHARHKISAGTFIRTYAVRVNTCNNKVVFLIEAGNGEVLKTSYRNRHLYNHVDNIIADHLCTLAGY